MKKILFLLLTISLFAACKDKPAKTSNTTHTETTTKTTKPSEKKMIGTAMKVDVAKSVLKWKGTKLGGEHKGTIKVSNGTIYSKDNKITGGKVTIDMNTINNTDLSGGWKTKLETHLKGAPGKEDDFFNVKAYPTATFEITKVIEVKNNPKATHRAMGNLTIKGVSKSIAIPCNITNDGSTVHITSDGFMIDRTKWGINYKSKTIFPSIKDKFVDDKMGVDLDITAVK